MKGFLVGIIVAGLLACGNQSSEEGVRKESATKVAPKRLAQRMATRLTKDRPDKKLRVVDDVTLEYGSDSDGGVVGTLSLENLKIKCEQEPAACDDHFEGFARSFLETFSAEERKPSRGQLRAVLKDSIYVENVRKALAKGPAEKKVDNEIFFKPLAGNLSIVYVLDGPSTMALVSRGTMKELKLDEASLHSLAMDNMLQAFPGRLRSEKVKASSTLHAVATGDSYEAARLLMTPKWAAVAQEFKGPVIAAVPSRDFLFYVDGAVKKDVALLVELAAKYEKESPYPLTASLFRFTGKGWKLHR